ncbi:hypothetical protein [Microlunatus parietis]
MTADELERLAATLDPTRWHIRRVFLTSGRFRGWWWVTIAAGHGRRTIRHFETQAEAIAITPKRRRSPDAHPAREPAPVPAELARDLDLDQGPGRLAL